MANGGPDTPTLNDLEAQFRAASPVFRDAVARSRDALGDGWAASFEETLVRVFPDQVALADAVAGYSRFSLDALRLQARFEREGVYAGKSYLDVVDEVYANEAYMTSCYLPGLLLSNYLWPHHYRQLRYFEEFFAAEMMRRDGQHFYDVGVGTGMYSRTALVRIPRSIGHGIDVSPASMAFAERHVGAFGAGERYRVELRDITAGPMEPLDWLICVEVIEHLEDPLAFLRSLRAMLRPGGKAFIGTALNAANSDHIYLYRTIDDVKSQLMVAGFSIEQSLCASAGPARDEDTPVAEVAAFVVA